MLSYESLEANREAVVLHREARPPPAILTRLPSKAREKLQLVCTCSRQDLSLPTVGESGGGWPP